MLVSWSRGSSTKGGLRCRTLSTKQKDPLGAINLMLRPSGRYSMEVGDWRFERWVTGMPDRTS